LLIFDFEYHCMAVAMFVKGMHAPMTQNLLTSPMYVESYASHGDFQQAATICQKHKNMSCYYPFAMNSGTFL